MHSIDERDEVVERMADPSGAVSAPAPHNGKGGRPLP